MGADQRAAVAADTIGRIPNRYVVRYAALFKASRINRHHAGVPSPVYTDLPPAEELAALFPAHLAVTTVISDARMYQVAGRKA